MASSTILRIIFESNNRASRGIQQLNNDLQKQREELARLRTVEAARNAQANVGLVQQRNQLRVQQAVQQAQKAQAQVGEVQQRNQLRLTQAIERARRADVAAQLAQQRVTLAARNVRFAQTPGNLLAYQVALEQQQVAANRAAQAQQALARIQQQGQVASARSAQANAVAQQRLAVVQQQASAANVRAVQQNVIAQQRLQSAQTTTAQGVGLISQAVSALGGAGGIATGLLAAGFAVATVAATALVNALQQAADLEVQQVQAANTLIRVLGVGRTDANQLIQDTVSQIIEIGQGQIDTALGIRISNIVVDEVAIGVQQQGGTQQQITQLSAELSARLASALTGQEERFGELQNVLGDILQGSQSLDQLRGRDILNDIGLNRVLIPLLQQRGVNNVDDLSNFQRLEVLLEALRITESDENILARANTVRGSFAVFLNRLFNPYTGLFGVQRDLEPEINGNQSVFEAFKASTIALIGRNGVFDNLGRLFESLGVGFDPLQPVRAAFLALNEFLIDVNRVVIQLRVLNERLESQGIEVGRVLQEIGRVIDLLGNLNPLRLLNPFTFEEAGRNIGRNIGRTLNGENNPLVNPSPVPSLPDLGILRPLPQLGSANPTLNIGSGAIVVQGLPGQNANEIADAVLSKMDRLLGIELNGVGGFI